MHNDNLENIEHKMLGAVGFLSATIRKRTGDAHQVLLATAKYLDNLTVIHDILSEKETNNMSEVQENMFRTAFANVNNLKRSYALFSAERSKQYPNHAQVQRHELEMAQAIFQLELSIRALQREARTDNKEDSDNGCSEV